ncbi:MAG: acetyl-CoA carboxylase biotin carboxyl carrier protein [Oligosphaeraceae bacterium]
MDTKIVQRLAEIMARHGLSELEIEEAGARVHLCRGGVAASPVAMASPVAVPVSEVPSASAPVQAEPSPASASASASASSVTTITSPLVGTFYTASSPEAEPFVHEGSVVTAGTTVCIIEAMKVMNEVKAESDGVITRVLLPNKSAVEYGTALFELKAN